MATQRKVCGMYSTQSGYSTFLITTNTTDSSLSVTGKFYKDDGTLRTSNWTVNARNVVVTDVSQVPNMGSEIGHIEVEYDGDPDALLVFANIVQNNPLQLTIIPSESI